MSAPPAEPNRLRHRGLLYTDRTSLIMAVVPLITRMTETGEAVVVVVDRATARELEDALGDGSRVTFPSPSTVARHGSPAFTTSLAGWAAAGPVLVVTQYAPGPVSEIDPSLSDLPVTLICACATEAGPDVRGAFHRDHVVLLPEPGSTDRPATTSVRTSLAETGDLAGVRRDVRRAALAAGFRGHELDRTVLAVHEAAVVAVRQRRGPRCQLEIRTGSGRLRADVVVPREPPDGSPGDDASGGGAPADAADDPGAELGSVRPFCRAASVHDGARGRSIRVLALVGG